MKIRNKLLKSLLLSLMSVAVLGYAVEAAVPTSPPEGAVEVTRGENASPLDAGSSSIVNMNMVDGDPTDTGYSNAKPNERQYLDTTTVNAGEIYVTSWYINNGSGTANVTISSRITGSGDITFEAWTEGTHNTYNFTGSMADYDGDISSVQGNLTVNFTGSARESVAGLGNIDIITTNKSEAVTFSLGAGDSTITNENITAGILRFNSASTTTDRSNYSVTSNITTSSLTIGAKANVTMESGSSLTLGVGSTLSQSADSSLTFATGSSLTVGAGSTFTNLTMADGSSMNLTLTDSATAGLTIGTLVKGGGLSLDLTLNSALIAGTTYTIFNLGDGSTSTFDLDNLTLTLNGLTTGFSTSYDSGLFTLTLEAGAKSLVLSSPGTWTTDATQTPWTDQATSASSAFANGDTVRIVNDTAGTENTITISGEVSPADDIVIAGAGDITLLAATANDKIVGFGKIVMDGTGTLKLTGAGEHSFSGGIDLNAGTLSISNAASLGTGSLNFAGGVLDITGGTAVSLDGSKITGGTLKINLSGTDATITTPTTGTHALELTGTGSLTTSWNKVSQVDVAEGATAIFNEKAATTVSKFISGGGTIVNASSNSVTGFYVKLNSSDKFTGSLVINDNQDGMLDITNSTSDARMALHIGASSEFILTSDGTARTIYLDSLTGTGAIHYTYNVTAGQQDLRHIDLQMTESQTFGGSITNDARNGNFIVSSTSGDNFELTLSGTGYGSNSSSTTQKQLQVQNATVRLTGTAATWNGVIDLQQSESELIFDHSAAFTRTSGAGEITGDGVVRIASEHGVALNGANSHTGGTRVMENAALDLGHNSAAGTGTLYLENAAKVRLADGLSVNNLIDVSGTATISTLSDGGTATLTGTIVNATASNKLVIGNGTEVSNITFTGRANDANIEVASSSTLLLSGATLNATTVLSGAGAITYESVTVDGVSVSTQKTLDSFLTAQGTTNTDVLQFTLTGLHVEAVESTTDSLTLNVTLTESELAAFTEAYVTDSEIVVFELAGVDALTAEYDDILINIVGTEYSSTALGLVYDGVTGNALLYIPEPSTVTLSMLALAGLLARRRRQVA